jgi:hypothetical protein
MVCKKASSLFEYYRFSKTDEKKYPVITRILKQLTPERIKKEIKNVQDAKLPPELHKWIREYKKVGERNDFLWKWIFRGTKIFTDDRGNKKYLNDLLNVKLLLFVLDTFLDDIADKYKNKRLLNEALKVPFAQKYIEFNKLNSREKKDLHFTITIWGQIQKIIKTFPRFKEFKDVFDYDVLQLLNTLKYSYLVHKNNYLYNSNEAWTYLPHSMQVITNITLELMCSLNFKLEELGKLRKVAWYAQRMSRIGNWVSTWEREIYEEDYTSGVYIYAIENKIIIPEELFNKKNSLRIIKRIRDSKIENKLLIEWEKNYIEINKLSREIKSINIAKMLSSLEKIIAFHLSSRGYK